VHLQLHQGRLPLQSLQLQELRLLSERYRKRRGAVPAAARPFFVPARAELKGRR
jgi:hypothetical protein